jgi:hypothetical protein
MSPLMKQSAGWGGGGLLLVLVLEHVSREAGWSYVRPSRHLHNGAVWATWIWEQLGRLYGWIIIRIHDYWKWIIEYSAIDRMLMTVVDVLEPSVTIVVSPLWVILGVWNSIQEYTGNRGIFIGVPLVLAMIGGLIYARWKGYRVNPVQTIRDVLWWLWCLIDTEAPARGRVASPRRR